MILYVNGDSHTAAAEAVNPAAFAEDDPRYNFLKRRPHPDNLNVSWGKRLSETLACKFICDAESASSNDRIMRTTRKWLDGASGNNSDQKLLVIQWSTWEREEWLIDGEYYQVNASGIDEVPDSHKEKYKEFVVSVDWNEKTNYWHNQIWEFHKELKERSVPHLFFNGNTSFSAIADKKDWGTNYIDPYSDEGTYDSILKSKGCRTVNSKSYHFDENGHRQWHYYVLHYINQNKMV